MYVLTKDQAVGVQDFAVVLETAEEAARALASPDLEPGRWSIRRLSGVAVLVQAPVTPEEAEKLAEDVLVSVRRL